MSDGETTEVSEHRIQTKIVEVTKKRGREKSSSVWRKFTIIDDVNDIASCNICLAKLSFKTTVTNLKKHIVRKHSYDVDKSSLIPRQIGNRNLTKRPKLSELGGLDGLILNVVGEEGGDPLNTEEDGGVPEVLSAEQMHNYCVLTDDNEEVEVQIQSDQVVETTEQNDYTSPKRRVFHQESTASKAQHTGNFQSKMDKNKRARIMDLQLECLEIKKYNMQMEALMMEQQLNLPRSIFTSNLHGADKTTRGTQTDVGGNNTKVYYITDKNGAKEGAHLFTFQARLDE